MPADAAAAPCRDNALGMRQSMPGSMEVCPVWKYARPTETGGDGVKGGTRATHLDVGGLLQQHAERRLALLLLGLLGFPLLPFPVLQVVYQQLLALPVAHHRLHGVHGRVSHQIRC